MFKVDALVKYMYIFSYHSMKINNVFIYEKLEYPLCIVLSNIRNVYVIYAHCGPTHF